MNGTGDSQLTLEAAPAGRTLPRANFPDGGLPGGRFTGDWFLYDSDPDVVFPEDPYPDALFSVLPFPADAFAEDAISNTAASSAASFGAASFGAASYNADVQGLIAAAGGLQLSPDCAGLIDQLRGLEDLKCVVAGLQARIAVAFDTAQRHARAQIGVPATEQGQGVAAQIALARGESPSR